MKRSTAKNVSLSAVVGKNIQASRKAKGLTQNQLAQELGVEVETVSRYERGLRAPSFPQLEKICSVLDVPAWLLFSDGRDMPDANAAVISELLSGLSNRDVEFVMSFVRQYCAQHRKA